MATEDSTSAGGGKGKRQLPAVRPRQDVGASAKGPLARLAGVEVDVTLLLGRTEITLEEASQLDAKSLLTHEAILDQNLLQADEPVEVLVNGELYARGKLVMVGNNYGVQLVEMIERGS